MHDMSKTIMQLHWYEYFLLTITKKLVPKVDPILDPCNHCSCVSEDIMVGNVPKSRAQVNWFTNSLEHFPTNALLLLNIPHLTIHWHETLHIFNEESHWFFHNITFNHASLGPPHALDITLQNFVNSFDAIHPLNVDKTTQIKLFNEMNHKMCYHIKKRWG